MHPEVIALDDPEQTEEGAFWFDYLSDSGDGQMAMYSLAYLTLGDLWAKQASLSLAPVTDGVRLPRGRFLFVGGDTAYHVADRATIAERFAAPFDWAHADRVKSGSLGDDGKPRYLLGIPGNHDYYDALLGFNHLFRHNTTPEDRRPLVADFHRRQDASFVTLKLPFGWWFWGLDTQHGRIDWRQRQFYADLAEAERPRRLIVATPEPTTAFGHVFEGHTQPYRALGLPRPFTDGKLPAPDHIHLDLAGDIHHYARYTAPETPNYASVLSGGGGAFLHPTHTNVPAEPGRAGWPPEPARVYPDHEVSCRETTLRLLCPWQIFRGGYVWLIGAVCAALVYFGVAVAPHTRGIAEWLNETIAVLTTGQRPQPPERSVQWIEKLAPAVVPPPQILKQAEEMQQRARKAPSWPAEVPALLGVALCLAAAFGLSRKPMARSRKQIVRLRAYLSSGACALGAVPMVALPYTLLGGVHEAPWASGFWCSLLVFLFAVPLASAWVWTSRYVGTLPKQAKYRAVTWIDYAPPWVAMGLGVLSLSFGLVSYGMHPIGQTASDILFIIAVLFVGLGPAGLGFFQAAAHRPLLARLPFAALGLYLGLLQLSIPLLLGLDGSGLRALVALTVALAFTGLAALWFATLGRARHLWALWLLAGLGVLLVSVVGHRTHEITLPRLILVFVAGGVSTCIWFGWYLAATLAFGGHNNEAGGAARLDRHRHFIRFKLEPDKLTGYVIALRRPQPEGTRLEPHIVETFELVPAVKDSGGSSDFSHVRRRRTPSNDEIMTAGSRLPGVVRAARHMNAENRRFGRHPGVARGLQNLALW